MKKYIGYTIAALSFCCVISPMAHAAGPATIKWIKTCAYPNDFDHGRWIMGLSDGSKIWAHYNPNQGRSAMYALAVSAYIAGKPVYYENVSVNTQVICGETATHTIDPTPGTTRTLMVGEP